MRYPKRIQGIKLIYRTLAISLQLTKCHHVPEGEEDCGSASMQQKATNLNVIAGRSQQVGQSWWRKVVHPHTTLRRKQLILKVIQAGNTVSFRERHNFALQLFGKLLESEFPRRASGTQAKRKSITGGQSGTFMGCFPYKFL